MFYGLFCVFGVGGVCALLFTKECGRLFASCCVIMHDVCGNSMCLRVLVAICCMNVYDVRFVYALFVCMFLRLFCACVLCV